MIAQRPAPPPLQAPDTPRAIVDTQTGCPPPIIQTHGRNQPRPRNNQSKYPNPFKQHKIAGKTKMNQV